MTYFKEETEEERGEELKIKKSKSELQFEKVERLRQEMLKASKELKEIRDKEEQKFLNLGKKALLLVLDENKELKKDINFIYLLAGIGGKISKLGIEDKKQIINLGKEKIKISDGLGIKLKEVTNE